jgi:hypothetical protein
MPHFALARSRPVRAALAGATALAASVVFVPVSRAAPPPSLLGDYHGTYQSGSSSLTESMEIRVEKQHKRAIQKARLFAQDMVEFWGPGKISRDGTTAKLNLHSAGHGRNESHMKMTLQVEDGGSTLAGDYVITEGGLSPHTGTLTVSK